MLSIRFWALNRATSLLIGRDSGSKLDLYIHAAVLVLSVISFEHGKGDSSYRSWIHWLTALAIYSFWFMSKEICSISESLYRQATPECMPYPPMPNSLESDRFWDVIDRYTTLFIEIPSLAFVRKFSQRCKSFRTSDVTLAFLYFRAFISS